MNEARRKQLDKAIGLIQEAQSIVETAADEEREYCDNMPESLQQGDKGLAAEEAATKLEEAKDALETLVGEIEEAKGQ